MNPVIKIPNKSHFKSDEVCSITGVKPYVLRFWESEFDGIRPLLSSSGQKLFEYKDIETILLIKKLLFNDKLTIEKAKFELTRIKMAKSCSPNLDETHAISSSEAEGSERPPSLPEGLAVRSLEEEDIQRLVMAKKELTKLLEATHNLQDRFNWS